MNRVWISWRDPHPVTCPSTCRFLNAVSRGLRLSLEFAVADARQGSHQGTPIPEKRFPSFLVNGMEQSLPVTTFTLDTGFRLFESLNCQMEDSISGEQILSRMENWYRV